MFQLAIQSSVYILHIIQCILKMGKFVLYVRTLFSFIQVLSSFLTPLFCSHYFDFMNLSVCTSYPLLIFNLHVLKDSKDKGQRL